MDLLLLGVAFLAGILTILAPCVLPLLPVIIGGSAASQDKWRPLIITVSLSVSVIIFTLLLKASTLFIDIPQSAWGMVSGGILIVIGLFMFFPKIWSTIAYKSGFEGGSGKLLNVAGGSNSRWSAILMGAALGPVFSSCSPTYFVILATVLPVSFAVGIVYLIAYALGLAVLLFLIAFFGQRIVMRLGWAANPKGLFKKIMALLIIAIGVAIITGYEKKLETKILDAGYGFITIEQELLEKVEIEEPVVIKKEAPKLPIRGLKTDTTKTSIDLSLILSGGPGKDGIPAIISPKFTSISDADVDDEILGIFVEFDGIQKFYPYTIMVWHEIANDKIGDTHFAVTFCPLCGSAIVFDRKIDGEIVSFGVSGLLYQSNLLMYDSKTESLWSQARGEAVVGDFTGTELTHLPMQLITFEELKEKYPQASVLSIDTGFNRNYGIYPYGDYEETERLYFPVTVSDKRFFAKEIMYVVPLNDQSISFPYKQIPEGKTAIEEHGLVLNRSGGEIEVTQNNQMLPGYFEMWFSWATHHQKDGVVWNEF